MSRIFNVNGDCKPKLHYMVNITGRLEQIRRMVEQGQYFTINRARQYGKTTTLKALKKFLDKEYCVIRLDFQRLGYASFETEQRFVMAFSKELLKYRGELPEETREQLISLGNADGRAYTLQDLFLVLGEWCRVSEKKIVLMIDEVDSATNNQVFLDFLAQLRSCYLDRDEFPTFQSVILAGVYDVKNIKRKIRPENEQKTNSPWNIAADFDVVMSFSRNEIADMLREYEQDHHINIDADDIAGLIYDYTAGYPYLVSRICKLLDEKVAENSSCTDLREVWSQRGFQEAIRILLSEKNTLFETLDGKLKDNPELQPVLYSLLFEGKPIVYNVFDHAVDIAMMFGFVRKKDGNVVVANRIFEILLYNYFLTSAASQNTKIFKAASENKSQFIRNGHLNMELVLQKFVEHYDSVYEDSAEKFDEDEGRRRFLLYLRPIINGTGNYYIEAETRNARRMDVVVDYLGERYVIELKVWRGNAYKERGEKQLSDYLEYFHLQKGYMLSYNFNQKKETGVKEIYLRDKILVEAVV